MTPRKAVAQMHSIGYNRGVKMSDQLREAVRASGQLPSEVADGAGVARSVLVRFMAGTTEMRTGNVDRLAAYLGLELKARKGAKHGKRD
jgi:hypothetical protein